MSKTPHPEHRYVEALLNNDGKLVEEIYRKYSGKMAAFIKKNQGSSDDARDIFQEALITIMKQARKKDFVLTCPFEAYLYLVCRGKWLNELK